MPVTDYRFRWRAIYERTTDPSKIWYVLLTDKAPGCFICYDPTDRGPCGAISGENSVLYDNGVTMPKSLVLGTPEPRRVLLMVHST